MALPAVDCCDTATLECSDAWAVGDHILHEVHDYLTKVIPQGCCDTLLTYLTMGDGDDGIVDALTVNLSRISPAQDSQRGTWSSRAYFEVRLRESGWPTIVDNGTEVKMPDPVAQNTLAAHAWSHCEAMYRKLVMMQKRPAGTGFQPEGHRVLASGVDTLRFLKPLGGVVGGVVPVTVDLPW